MEVGELRLSHWYVFRGVTIRGGEGSQGTVLHETAMVPPDEQIGCQEYL